MRPSSNHKRWTSYSHCRWSRTTWAHQWWGWTASTRPSLSTTQKCSIPVSRRKFNLTASKWTQVLSLTELAALKRDRSSSTQKKHSHQLSTSHHNHKRRTRQKVRLNRSCSASAAEAENRPTLRLISRKLAQLSTALKPKSRQLSKRKIWKRSSALRTWFQRTSPDFSREQRSKTFKHSSTPEQSNCRQFLK